MPRPRPLPPAIARLCHAIAMATRRRTGWWCGIDAALEHVPAADRAGHVGIILAAVAGGLVEVNPGTTAHSIRLTEAGRRLPPIRARKLARRPA